MTAVPAQSPVGLYIVHQNSTAFLVWDSVKKDINQQPINIVGYYIYRTYSPNANYWTIPYLAFVETINPYSETDVFWVDYNSIGDALYKVCPIDNLGNIGNCTIGYGVSSEGSITVPSVAVWDGTNTNSEWDIGMWG